jgi:hypothetical protein
MLLNVLLLLHCTCVQCIWKGAKKTVFHVLQDLYVMKPQCKRTLNKVTREHPPSIKELSVTVDMRLVQLLKESHE